MYMTNGRKLLQSRLYHASRQTALTRIRVLFIGVSLTFLLFLLSTSPEKQTRVPGQLLLQDDVPCPSVAVTTAADEQMVTPNQAKHQQQQQQLQVPGPQYQLAFDQSYGFFEDIDEHTWRTYYQARAREAKHYRWESHKDKDVRFPAHWKFFNWDP
jgi:hypothetical protein